MMERGVGQLKLVNVSSKNNCSTVWLNSNAPMKIVWECECKSMIHI